MYKRVLLKLSGEALSSKSSTFDSEILNSLANEIKRVVHSGVQVAIVVGGGNVIRGKFANEMNIPRVEADKMGMLGTVINALALRAALERNGQKAYVQSAIEMNRICDLVNYERAIEKLEENVVVIYGGGTTNPYFSTDSAAALRACEINCQAILMGKNGTDGVYDKDPNKYNDAVKFKEMTYHDILEKKLKIMDATAAGLLDDNDIDTVVFNINEFKNITKVLENPSIGTVIRG